MDAQNPNKRKRTNDEENEQLRARIAELEDRLAAKEERERGSDEAPSQKQYQEVHVLMADWEWCELGVGGEILALTDVFKDKYGFKVTEFVIPDDDAQEEMEEHVERWIASHQGPQTLLIFVYAGHGEKSGDDLMWMGDASTDRIYSEEIQFLFEKAASDCLLIYDCCKAAVTNCEGGTIRETGNITDVMSACGFDGAAAGPGRTSFSNALIWALKRHSKKEFPVRQLYNWTLHRLRGKEGTGTPVYTNLTGDGDRQIKLRSLLARKEE